MRQLITEVKEVHQRTTIIFKKNIEMEKSPTYFNERALVAGLEFAMLSMQAINVIGIEELLEEDTHTGEVYKMVLSVLNFHQIAMQAVMSVERKIRQFRQAQLSGFMDYAEFAQKYYAVLPLFFWWVSSNSKEACDVARN